MSYPRSTIIGEINIATRIANFTRDRTCFSFACKREAQWLVRRHDGVRIPKCDPCATVYGDCEKQPIGVEP